MMGVMRKVTAYSDAEARRRRAVLEAHGFTCGARNPRLNRNYQGKYMVVEDHDESQLPTDDGSNGPWCIVGDDLTTLVQMAYDVWFEDDGR